MRTFDLLVPCHFGLEAVLKREIYDLGYEITKVEDGRVTFEGDEEAICRANIFLRTAERVMIQVGRFKATTFEELFQGIKNLPWEEYIPEDGKFWVKKASSIKSKLFSPSYIQSIMKKAMVEIYSSFKENNIQSKMLLQVHDELIFDVKKEEKDQVIAIVKDKMENAIKLDVPIKVSSDLGTNWYDTK